jgi:hypothetical protein
LFESHLTPLSLSVSLPLSFSLSLFRSLALSLLSLAAQVEWGKSVADVREAVAPFAGMMREWRAAHPAKRAQLVQLGGIAVLHKTKLDRSENKDLALMHLFMQKFRLCYLF